MALKKHRTAIILAICIASLATVIATAGVLTTQQTLSTTGTITAINLGVYSDAACTVPITSINWGATSPGGQTTKTIYLKNTGNVAETLSMATNSWSPSNAMSYLTVSWTPGTTSLAVGAVTPATLTLAANAGAGVISSFSLNIVITGTQ